MKVYFELAAYMAGVMLAAAAIAFGIKAVWPDALWDGCIYAGTLLASIGSICALPLIGRRRA